MLNRCFNIFFLHRNDHARTFFCCVDACRVWVMSAGHVRWPLIPMHTKVQSLRDEVHLSVISEQVSLCEEPNPNRIKWAFIARYVYTCLFRDRCFHSATEWQGQGWMTWTLNFTCWPHAQTLAELQTHLLQPSLGTAFG